MQFNVPLKRPFTSPIYSRGIFISFLSAEFRCKKPSSITHPARLLVPLKSTKTSFLKTHGKPMAQQGAEPEGYIATSTNPFILQELKLPSSAPTSLLAVFYSFPALRASGLLHLFPFLSLSFFWSLSKFIPSRERNTISIWLPLPLPCWCKAQLRSRADLDGKRHFPCPVLKSGQKEDNCKKKKKKSACWRYSVEHLNTQGEE